MFELIVPSFYILTGFCCYACFTHFAVGFDRPRNYPQILFGFTTLVLMFFSVFNIQTLTAETIDSFVVSLRWTLAFGALLYGCLFWFVAISTKKIPVALSIFVAIFVVVLIAINFSQPYTLQFSHIDELTRLTLPWGETLTYAIGQPNKYFLIRVLTLNLTLLYLVYVLGRVYFNDRTGVNLAMFLSMIFLIIFVVQGILARLSIIHFVPLGMYGFLGLVVTMSLILRHDLRQKSRLANNVYDAIAEGMMVLDANSKIISVNPAFTLITGYQLNEVLGRDPTYLSSGRQDERFYQEMWDTVKATGKWQGELWNKRKSGEAYCEWLSISTIYNDDHSVSRRIGFLRDNTDEKLNEEIIWKQANFDDLTGLLNRRALTERLDQEIKRSSSLGLSFALILVDLDRFKEVNDMLGHAVGDALLKIVGQRMENSVSSTCAIGRLGGDEFAIVIGDVVDISNVGSIASTLLERLATPYRLGQDFAFTSASIGITFYPEDAIDITSLWKNADQAMYAAKCQGRNQYQYYTPELQEAADKRGRLSRDLHDAVHGNQFILHYQPIINLQSGAIHKAEALVRWKHPELGTISPADFIPIAEENGQIVEIGNWVFCEAANQVARLREIYSAEFQISINKSPVQFRSSLNKHDNWLEYLQEKGLSGSSIVVEITEGLLMEAKDDIYSQLMLFRDNGMQVALDDFGTGYSSLSYLKKFDIDYIKIDQSFIRNLTPQSEDITLCEAMVVMAHKLGIKVIAEGVETEQQRDLLKRIGCDYGQGYWFSKPVPADAFEKYLEIHAEKMGCNLL
ncbi:MAG TPA: EAL domain-containing protein [Methylophilaceae bacterium]|jgi:diguanylate cyclase (GGDEF)-like protein/PAS domain S-box-containing protein